MEIQKRIRNILQNRIDLGADNYGGCDYCENPAGINLNQNRVREILEGQIAMGGEDLLELYEIPAPRYRRRRRRVNAGGVFAGGVVVGGSGMRYIDFVKEWHMAHPHYSWKQAMKLASKDYHAITGVPKRRKVRAGYGTKAGARKALRTKRREGLIGRKRRKRVVRRRSGSKRRSNKSLNRMLRSLY